MSGYDYALWEAKIIVSEPHQSNLLKKSSENYFRIRLFGPIKKQ
jgi:hypothetical protein